MKPELEVLWHITTAGRAKKILADGFKLQKTAKGPAVSFSQSPYSAQGLLRTAQRLYEFDRPYEVVDFFMDLGADPEELERGYRSWEHAAEKKGAWKQTPGGLYVSLMPFISDVLPRNEFLWSDIGNNLARAVYQDDDEVVAIEASRWGSPFHYFEEDDIFYAGPDAIEGELLVRDPMDLSDVNDSDLEVIEDPDDPYWQHQQEIYDEIWGKD